MTATRHKHNLGQNQYYLGSDGERVTGAWLMRRARQVLRESDPEAAPPETISDAIAILEEAGIADEIVSAR